jgi:hypothetical protein
LTQEAFAFEPGGRCGHRRVLHTADYFILDFRDRLAVPTGLLPRCRAELEAHGYTLELEDCRRFGASLQPNSQILARATAEERPFLEAVAAEPLGQIEVRGFKDTVRKITRICALFLAARVAVAVATRRQAWAFWQALRTSLRQPVGLVCAGHNRRGVRGGARCVVCTAEFLPVATCKAPDILLLPAAEQTAGNVAGAAIAQVEPLRCHAFVLPGRLPRRTELRLEGLAGPRIHTLQQPKENVRVLLVGLPRGKSVAASALERKRRAYWDNKVRNQRIAGIARAFSVGDQKALRKLLGAAGRRMPTAGLRMAPMAPMAPMAQMARVAVLVESTEHGRHLLGLLPGAVMVDAAPKKQPESTPPPLQQAAAPVPVIVTTTAAARGEAPVVDVLVRASGGDSRLNVRGFPATPAPASPKGSADDRELLLVDFDDAFDAAAARDTAARLCDYEALGFKVEARATKHKHK